MLRTARRPRARFPPLAGSLLLIALVASMPAPASAAGAAEATARHAVIVSIDGLEPACCLEADALGPELRR